MPKIIINSAEQILQLKHKEDVLAQYPISTALAGLGEKRDSGQTPRGRHRVYAKIGDNLDSNTIFVGRKAQSELYSPALGRHYPQRDWILSRILWLEGLEEGYNKGGDMDTLSRYIYIHGTAHVAQLGSPVSKGCIRLHPADMIALYQAVSLHCNVLIE